MNLIENSFNNNEYNKKTKNSSKVILITIAIIFALIVIILVTMPFLKTKDNPLKVTLNGEGKDEIGKILLFEENGKVYIPIREIAQYFGYNSYNGDYSNKSEQTNQCYVESDEEVVMFTVNSNKIYKTVPNSTKYEYYYIDEPVASKGGKLYTTMDGIKKTFNTNFIYDQEKNKIIIQTMDYLVESYKDAIIDFGFGDISTKFNDKKAILKNLSIVKDSKGRYGLFNISTDETLMETKYDKIEYIPTSGQFLVKSNNLLGVYSDTGKEKVSISYDKIELMDQDKKLYVVKKDEKYGMLNFNEDIKISIDYDQIGINISSFEKNNVKSKYILVDKIIPVKKDDLWALFNINGDQLTEFKYDSLGYTASTNKEAENLLFIPDYNVIVVRKDKKYGLVNAYGEELFNGSFFDDVYMTVTSTETKYYIGRNGKKWDAEEQLEKIGVTKLSQNEEQIDEEQTDEEQTDEEQTDGEQQNDEE